MTGDAVQRKWKNLRDRYAREESKMKAMKSGSGGKRKTSYMYAQQLSFLRDVMAYRATTSSLQTSSERESQQTQGEQADRNADNVENLNEHPTPEESPFLNKKTSAKRRRLDQVESKIILALEANAARQERLEKNEDDDRLFLLSLLPIMKTIPDHLKLSSRVEIMQTVNKYATYPTVSPPLCLPQHQFVQGNQHQTHCNQPQLQPSFQLQHRQLNPPPQQSPILHNLAASPAESAGSYMSTFSTGDESIMSIF